MQMMMMMMMVVDGGQSAGGLYPQDWGRDDHLRDGAPAPPSPATVHWVWCARSYLSTTKDDHHQIMIIIAVVTNLLSAELCESDIVDGSV